MQERETRTYHGVATVSVELGVRHEGKVVEGFVEYAQDEGRNARHGQIEEHLD